MLPAMVRTALLLDDYFLRHRTASGHPECPEQFPRSKALYPLVNVSIISSRRANLDDIASFQIRATRRGP